MSQSSSPEPANHLSPGERVAFYREKRGLTRAALAGLVGRGPSWLKKIELGERPLRDYEMLSRLANVLRVPDLRLLTGEPPAESTNAPRKLVLPWVPALRKAVRGCLFAMDSPDEPPSVDMLRGRVSGAWQLWHASRHQRSEVGQLLPDLIADGQRATRALDGVERRRANAVLADLYHLAQQAMAYACEPELYWVVADRGRSAAQDADDPLSLAGAAWAFANGLRETGYSDEAIEVVTEAADMLRPRVETGSSDVRGMYGALNLHAAVTYAREGREGDAWRHWDEADRVASALPRSYAHPWTVFGRGNTDFHAVSIGVDLRTPGVALERADEIDLDTVPSLERQSRVLVELGRAHSQSRDKAAAFHYMERAFEISPETVRYTPSARGVVVELATKARGPLKSDAMRLAGAVGVLPG